jgi:hypothetical protein
MFFMCVCVSVSVSLTAITHQEIRVGALTHISGHEQKVHVSTVLGK